jgi:hypothetical protein
MVVRYRDPLQALKQADQRLVVVVIMDVVAGCFFDVLTSTSQAIICESANKGVPFTPSRHHPAF